MKIDKTVFFIDFISAVCQGFNHILVKVLVPLHLGWCEKSGCGRPHPEMIF